MIDLYVKCLRGSSFRIYYLKFTGHRSSYCVQYKVIERDTCVCFIFENFSLFLISIYNQNEIEHISIDILTALTCQQRIEDCLAKKSKDYVQKNNHQIR